MNDISLYTLAGVLLLFYPPMLFFGNEIYSYKKVMRLRKKIDDASEQEVFALSQLYKVALEVRTNRSNFFFVHMFLIELLTLIGFMSGYAYHILLISNAHYAAFIFFGGFLCSLFQSILMIRRLYERPDEFFYPGEES